MKDVRILNELKLQVSLKIFLLQISLPEIKPGGLDWSRRDLDLDLDLDAKKKSVSTVEKISTSLKNWSRR
jgi:hypothetical protein